MRIDHRIVFHFGKQQKTHGKLQVGSWFWGFSRIFDFSVYFNKWHVCLGSYILEQEESRDIRKKDRVEEQGRDEIR